MDSEMTELARSGLGGRHVYDLELESVRTGEVDRIVASQTERILARPLEKPASDARHELRHLVHLRMSGDVEGDVVEARLVEAVGPSAKPRLRLPDVEGHAVRLVQIHGETRSGRRVEPDLAWREAQEGQQRGEEAHRALEIRHADRDVVDRAVQHRPHGATRRAIHARVR